MWFLFAGGAATTGGNSGSASCIFPYTYSGQTYTQCIDAFNSGVFWCPTADLNGIDYVSGTTKWGNCISKEH